MTDALQQAQGVTPWRQALAFGFALIGATLGVVLWLGLVYALGEDPSRPSIRLEAGALEITAGEGRPTEQGLVIERPAANGLVLIQGVTRPLRAQDYPALRWEVKGLSEDQELRFVWATPASVRRPFDRILTPEERRAAEIRLAADPRWEGTIVALGLAVIDPRGDLASSILIRSLTLMPRRPALAELPHLIWADWLRDQGWIGRSINFTDSAAGQARIRPLWSVAIWCALAALIYLVLVPPWRGGRSWLPYLAVLLLGWCVLDVRWQALLVERLDQVRSLYAGLSGEERQRAGPDQSFWPFVQTLRAELGSKPQRVWIIADPADYVANRLRYHLLPHNIRLLPELGETAGLQVGDTVFLKGSAAGRLYDPTRKVLIFAKRQVQVVPRLDLGGFGTLLQVTEVD